MYHEKLAHMLIYLINKKGILNIGGKIQSIYNFAKKNNPKINKSSAKKMYGNKYPLNQSMNINKFIKIIKKK
jgi:dTDP-4-dehydrorhamnose reductase